MIWPIETIVDLANGCERIRAGRYCVIETAGGELRAVHLRAWPKLLAAPELFPLGPKRPFRALHLWHPNSSRIVP